MTLPTRKTPPWLLERMAQGELDGAEVAELRARLAAEGRSLDEELERLRQSDRQILARLPRETMAASIRRRAAMDAQVGPRSRLNMLFPPLALAGALGLVILVARGLGDTGIGGPVANRAADDEVTIIKGELPRSPRLLVYRQRPGRGAAAASELLSDGASGARGDLLQLAYNKAPDGLYGVLISIDGAGKITQHLPEEGASQSPALTSLREIRLPSAYELDDAPDFERFVLVTSTEPFALAVVLDAANALARHGGTARTRPLPLAPSFRQTSILLDKTRGGTP
jgi:hypothetical protein